MRTLIYFVIFGRLTMEKPLHEKICLSWFEVDWLFYSQKQGWLHMLVFALLFEHHAIPCTPCFPCADPGISSGGTGSIWQKKGGYNFFQGGGVQLLIPYRNSYNLWISRGSGPPDPPLDPHLLSRPAGDSFFPFSRLWVVFFSFI